MIRTMKVSVCCISYNHEKYLRECLDSIMMQEVDFDYEILINDDASTDGTIRIIQEYAGKYPEIIKPVLHSENQHSNGKRNFTARYLIPKAKGEYLAVCEGDDYWTDPTKLQRQVDFLEKHPDYALVFHPVQVTFENHEQEDSVFPGEKSGFTVQRLLEGNFIQTNSVMYRKVDEYNDLVLDVMPGDWYLHLYHAQFGKIGFIDKVMSTYRRHEGGMWWDSTHDISKIWRSHGMGHLALYMEMARMYGDEKYEPIIDKHIARLYQNIIKADLDKGHVKMVQAAIDNYPRSVTRAFRGYSYLEDQSESDVQRKTKELERCQAELTTAQEALRGVELTVSTLRNSHTWKIGRMFTGLAERIIRLVRVFYRDK